MGKGLPGVPYLEVCITNLGAYNRGKLIYERLSLPADAETLAETIQAVLEFDEECCAEGDEEIFISDYETNLEVKIDEYENLTQLSDTWEELESSRGYHSASIDEINALIRACDGDLDRAITYLDNGDYLCISNVDSEEKLGMAIVDEGHFGEEIPESLSRYIDYEAIGRDWRINADGDLYEDLGLFIDLYH